MAKWKTATALIRKSDPLTVFHFVKPPSPARGEGTTTTTTRRKKHFENAKHSLAP
jgi:hypothetical protein